MNQRSWMCALCFSLVSALAQQNGAAPQSGHPASVAPGSPNRQMTLDVVVTDRSGKPATGLLQRDFTLLDNKRPQNILSFREVDGGAAAADLPVEVILIVDEINTEFTNVTMERVEIEKFLRQNGGVLAQPTSVIFFSDKEATGTSSSRDGNAVIQELSGKLSGLRTVGRAQSTYGNNERMQFSLNGLKRLSDYEAGTTGRKLVVWISPGWPFFTATPETLPGIGAATSCGSSLSALGCRWIEPSIERSATTTSRGRPLSSKNTVRVPSSCGWLIVRN